MIRQAMVCYAGIGDVMLDHDMLCVVMLRYGVHGKVLFLGCG